MTEKQIQDGLIAPWFFGTCGLEQLTPGGAIPNFVAAVQEMERLGYTAIGFTDQTQSWITRSLWDPEIVPGAAVYPDYEAFFETIPLLAVAAYATSTIRLGTTIDAYRRPPGLLAQTLKTLDHISKGRVSVSIGTGESKQLEPFGLFREEPRNARLEDMVATVKALVSSTEPVTRESKYHPMDKALLALPPYDVRRPPRVFISGGGPRVMRAVARVADGLSTYLPGAYGDRVEGLEEDLATLFEEVEIMGRDPKSIVVNARNVMMCLCEDDEQIQRVYDNPYLRYSAINLTPKGSTFRAWGGEHPLGDDYIYSQHHRSTSYDRHEALDLCGKITDEDISHIYYIGTPEDVAARSAPWLKVAGVESVKLTFAANYAQFVLPELAEASDDGTPRWHRLMVRYTDELNRLLGS